MKQEHARILDHDGATNADGQGTTAAKKQVPEQQLSREEVAQTTLFHFGESPVRVAVNDGHYLFVVADLCAALQHSNPTMAVARLDEDAKGLISIEAPGGPQAVNVVNESGLYSLVLSSRKALQSASSAGSPTKSCPRSARQGATPSRGPGSQRPSSPTAARSSAASSPWSWATGSTATNSRPRC